MMRIDKILNNNAIVSLDARGAEIVAMGRGLGFQRKVGDSVDDGAVEKIFRLESGEVAARFQEVVAAIPIESFIMTERIIDFAKREFKMRLSDGIFVSLPDHIHTALERYRSGMVLKNPILLDIRRCFRDEYLVGEKAVEIVAEETGVRFAPDEAGFIAMHFVNAGLGGESRDSESLIQDIDGITSIVRDWVGGADEDSMSWYRFVTHVRFFVERLSLSADYPSGNFELYEIVKARYPTSFAGAARVAEYVLGRYAHEVSEEEMVYLTMHIERLAARK